MPSSKSRAVHHASKKRLRNQDDSRHRELLSHPLSRGSSAAHSACGRDGATRRGTFAGWAACAILVDFPSRSRRSPYRPRQAPSAVASRPRLSSRSSLRCSLAWNLSCPTAPTLPRTDDLNAPRTCAGRSPIEEKQLLRTGAARKTTATCSRAHHAGVGRCGASSFPAPACRPPGPNRPSRCRIRPPGRKRSPVDGLVQNGSGAWVLLWISGAGLLAVVTGLLAYALVSRSGVPAATAWLAGITASAAAARILVGVPGAIKALKDLRT